MHAPAKAQGDSSGVRALRPNLAVARSPSLIQGRWAFDLGIVTLAVSLRREATNLCGLHKWCSQARLLASIVPQSEVAILTPFSFLEDCPAARLIPWDTDLERKLTAYTNRVAIADGPVERKFFAVNMQKLQLLAERQYRALFFTDWDVDLLPSLPKASWAWAHYFRPFLADRRALFLGSPDEKAPVNGGVFLVKTASRAYQLALREQTDSNPCPSHISLLTYTWQKKKSHAMLYNYYLPTSTTFPTIIMPTIPADLSLSLWAFCAHTSSCVPSLLIEA
jgi:hypothetical protein